jgi:hypothetical protein
MAEPALAPAGAAAERAANAGKFTRRMRNPWLVRGFFLAKLPLALVAGLRLEELTPERCATSVPYGWRTTNPFRSTYFAALSMAAELSTGALAMAAVESAPRPVAMLITGLTAGFEKKATGLTTFTCTDGPRLFEAVARTIATGEPAAVEVPTVGTSPDGVVVARFTFTWSFKVRR